MRSGVNTLYQFDFSTGDLVSTVSLQGRSQDLLYIDGGTGMGLGGRSLGEDLPAEYWLLRYNLQDGTSTALSPFSFDSYGWYGMYSGLFLDPDDRHVWAMSTASTLYKFIALTGDVVGTTELTLESGVNMQNWALLPEPASTALLLLGLPALLIKRSR